MVYVDELLPHGMILRGRPVRTCHMIADDEGELRDFADRLKLKQHWAHKTSRGVWHFDLVESKRRVAVRLGVEELTMRQFVELHKYLERQAASAT